ncbi:MAG: transposase [Kineosporiaceae bacterium]
MSWWTVQAVLNAAALLGIDPDAASPRRLGIDEHRYRSVRYWRDEHGTWRRYEPWMSTIVDVDTEGVLGVVDGRGAAGVAAWLAARPPRSGGTGSRSSRSTPLRRSAPHYVTSSRRRRSVSRRVPPVRLANDTLTRVRQRPARQTKGRRGRGVDPVWFNRRLLLRAGDTLSPAGLARLEATFTAGDPTQEIAAAWAVKERLRHLLHATTLTDLDHRRDLFTDAVTAAAMPETDRLAATITTWWPAIEVLVITGVTNARTEAANTTIKQIKRTGRGYRNPHHYKTRILLANAAPTAA